LQLLEADVAHKDPIVFNAPIPGVIIPDAVVNNPIVSDADLGVVNENCMNLSSA